MTTSASPHSPYSAVIFDLDGTLLDTLDDLTDAVNAVLTAHQLPPRTREEVRRFVGNGVEVLMERALPHGRETTAQAPDGRTVDFPALLADFKARYAIGCQRKTRPYPGILPLLGALRDAGIPVAVVSNKFDAAVKALVSSYFGEFVPVAVGEREGVRKKPAPDTVREAIRLLGLSPDAVASHPPVYVGDSEVDIATASAAGLPCISVLWGFRSREFLLSCGATVCVADAGELKDRIVS